MATKLLSPIVRTSPAEEVLQRISGLIESGKLPMGSLLPSERHLAAEMGVSRVVVREAAKKLEQQGLVRIQQGIGVTVINNPSWPLQQSLNHVLPETKERLRQCAQARVLIEPELAASAAKRATEADVERLWLLHERLATETNIEAGALADIAFHDGIADIAGNKVLSLMLTSISELGRLSREHTLGEYGTERACEHHLKIWQAIRANDARAARQAMKIHLTTALGDLD